MKVHELVTRCARAGESADPMNSVREVLESLRSNLADIEGTLQHIPGTGGNARQIFYRAPELVMLKVCFPNGRRTPPHDHGTWAAILLLSGEEKNTLYRRESGALRKAGHVTLARGSILTMRPDTVHVAECVGDAPASACMSTAATSWSCRGGCGTRRPSRSTRSSGRSTRPSRALPRQRRARPWLKPGSSRPRPPRTSRSRRAGRRARRAPGRGGKAPCRPAPAP